MTLRFVAILLCLATRVFAGEPPRWDRFELAEIATRASQADPCDKIGSGWHHYSTPYYDVYTQAGATFTAELSLFMDRLHNQFTLVFPFDSRVDMRPQVVVFWNRTRYRDYLKNNARGYYRDRFDGKHHFTEHTLYTYAEGAEPADFSTFYFPILQHEGTHQILQQIVGPVDIPPWLGEGLATYFQAWDLNAQAPDRIARRSKCLVNPSDFAAAAANGLPQLKDLLGIKRGFWDTDDFGPRTKARYATAEALFMHLLGNTRGLVVARRLIELFRSGQDPGTQLLRERPDLQTSLDAFVHSDLLPIVKAGNR